VIFHGGKRKKEANHRGKETGARNLIHRVEHDEVTPAKELNTDASSHGVAHVQHGSAGGRGRRRRGAGLLRARPLAG
jgi:hypothetical protein